MWKSDSLNLDLYLSHFTFYHFNIFSDEVPVTMNFSRFGNNNRCKEND